MSFFYTQLPARDKQLDEISLFHELDQDGIGPERKKEIVEILARNNIRLVTYIIRKRYPDPSELCRSYRITFDDLFATGHYGLLKAIYTFDQNRGLKFATYAARCIHNEYGMFVRQNRRSLIVDSIENPISKDQDGNDLTLVDLLSISDESEYILNKYAERDLYLRLERQVSARDLQILRKYLEGDMTQKELSNYFGISQSYISRIVNKTLARAKWIYTHQMEC